MTRPSASWANSRLTIPAATEISRDSVRRRRTTGHRDAPSDSRNAISLCLPEARARWRFATLKQAMSNTNPTMPMRIADRRSALSMVASG